MAADPASAQPIHLDDIVEIRGYPPTPEAQPGTTQSVNTPPIDLKGQAVRAFLKPIRSGQKRGRDGQGIQLGLGHRRLQRPGGQPHMLAFVVDHDFVMFQLRNLCGSPPPGFKCSR
jgi:hypothetical protein